MRLLPHIIFASLVPQMDGSKTSPDSAQAVLEGKSQTHQPKAEAVTAAQGPIFFPSSNQQGAIKAPAIPRDFKHFPLKMHLEGKAIPEQFCVLSDTHAGANVFFDLLLNNGVIAKRPKGESVRPCHELFGGDWGEFRWSNPYSWSYGKNVLVSLGDRMNKGSFNLVTACFFMDLQQQAEQAGGRVVLQWGNHETTTLESWDNQKTRGPGGFLWELEAYGIDPNDFFSPDSAFGRHLLRQPIATQIGDQIVMVHGGTCPSDRSLDEDLLALEQGLKKDGFATDELKNENSLVRCRIHTGRKGEVTQGNSTEVIYGHDPEHEPRGQPYCFSAAKTGEKPFTYCRTDVGMTPYINYSKGWLEKYTQQAQGLARQKCNELGACAELAVGGPERNLTAAPPVQPLLIQHPKRVAVQPPTHRPHSGADRNFTSHPAIAVVLAPKADLYVLGDPLGALLSTKALLAAAGLIAGSALFDEPRWTGKAATLVVTGNLFGAGYLNLETIDLFRQLGEQATQHGGSVHALLGSREVDFLDDPNNDDTWAGGGIACQILGNNSWPDTFATLDNPIYRHMFNQPFGVRWQDLLILSGGQTSNRFWKDLGDDLAEAIKLDGFAASLVSGDNSVTKKTNFAGRDGKQGPLLAKDAGVTSIIHGLDLAMEPLDDIKPYGIKGKTVSLFNVATRLNPSLGGGTGKILHVRRDGKRMLYDALDSRGRRKKVAANPFNPALV